MKKITFRVPPRKLVDLDNIPVYPYLFKVWELIDKMGDTYLCAKPVQRLPRIQS